MTTDDTAPNSSSGEEEVAEETEGRPERSGSQPDTTDGGGGAGGEATVPYSRFKQVNDVARYYQRNLGNFTPEQLQGFKAYLAQQDEAANSSEGGQYTKEQLAQVRRVMREADAEYREMVQERERQRQERAQGEEEMLDDTHDEIYRLAKAEGLPTDDEQLMIVIGQSVMLAIRNDRKLSRQWNNGDLSSVLPAFEKIKKAWKGAKAGQGNNIARIKRQVANLPTAPSGGAGTVTAPPPKSKDEKGITKSTHDRAWALLQSQSE